MNKKIGLVVLLIVSILIITFITLNNNSNSTNNKTSSDTKVTTYEKENIDWDKYEVKKIELSSDLTITESGIYELTGTLNGTIKINTTGYVKLILNSVDITSSDNAINIEKAKEVYIELIGENNISGGSLELNGLIYSKSDLIITGTGTLNIKSNYDAIVSKDNLIINSGNINITTGSGATIKDGKIMFDDNSNKSDDSKKGLKSSDEIIINGGEITINSEDDSIHSNLNITINDGLINIKSGDDGIHADGKLEINNGDISVIASEGLEATYVKINDGNINIIASDDGINAGNKSDKYSVSIEINGGDITIDMGQGDTDVIDSNGDLYINGGTLNITGNSPFDYDGKAAYNGGTMIVNGNTTTEITNQFGGDPTGGIGPGGKEPNIRR